MPHNTLNRVDSKGCLESENWKRFQYRVAESWTYLKRQARRVLIGSLEIYTLSRYPFTDDDYYGLDDCNISEILGHDALQHEVREIL
uniref:Uncharacterized protein n=1 Tax=Octopus bimaculoides TaxID=37653 RepID=A0A0L8HJI4_OCTBM